MNKLFVNLLRSFLLPSKVKVRLIKGSLPKKSFFVPKEDSGEIIKSEEVISITVAEWETLRLCDLENFKQRDVAQLMHLSQPTVNRLLAKAHSKIAYALYHGNVIRFEDELIECPKCKERLSTSRTSIHCPNCNEFIETE